MRVTIFYSWQSDTRAAANRTFIHQALESAAKELRQDESLSVDPVTDRDTANVAGSPDIAETILKKIDLSHIFLGDVTIVTQDEARPSPNPNVLVELGYAMKALGTERIILVQNLAFGGRRNTPRPPEAAVRVLQSFSL